MKKAKLGHILQTRFIEENQPLIFSEDDLEKTDYSQVPYETEIAKGTIKFLGKWPTHLHAAFVTGCFITTIIFLFILIIIFFSYPVTNQKYRKIRDVKIEESHNVYFIKQANHTWTMKELCYIETAARNHPELNIFLIDLMSDDSLQNNNPALEELNNMGDNSFLPFVSRPQHDKIFLIENLSPEMHLRKKIANYNSNVQNIEILTERFFQGSVLYNIYKKLSSEMLEIAARVYLLWNYPGIALNPVMYNSLNDLHQYFCDKRKKSCNSENDFTIEIKGDLQASNIPCHAFAGFFMQEIIKNKLFDHNGLKQVFSDFCPSTQNCPGVKILKRKDSYSLNGVFCPTIYPDGFPSDIEDLII